MLLSCDASNLSTYLLGRSWKYMRLGGHSQGTMISWNYVIKNTKRVEERSKNVFSSSGLKVNHLRFTIREYKNTVRR